MTGKDKCALLKFIRIRLAELNNITYTPHPCDNTEDCSGTCEMCDAESKWLLRTMRKLERKGFPVVFSLNETDEFVVDKNVNVIDVLRIRGL